MKREITRMIAALLWRYAMIEREHDRQGRQVKNCNEYNALTWVLRMVGDQYPTEYKTAIGRIQERYVQVVARDDDDEDE